MRRFTFFNETTHTKLLVLSIAMLLFIQEFAAAQVRHKSAASPGGEGDKKLFIIAGSVFGGGLAITSLIFAYAFREKLADWCRSLSFKPMNEEMYNRILNQIASIPCDNRLLHVENWLNNITFSPPATSNAVTIPKEILPGHLAELFKTKPEHYLDDAWNGITIDPHYQKLEQVTFNVSLAFQFDADHDRITFSSAEHSDRYGKFRITDGILELKTQHFTASKVYFEPSHDGYNHYTSQHVGLFDWMISENNELRITLRGSWYAKDQPHYQGVFEYTKTNPIILSSSYGINQNTVPNASEEINSITVQTMDEASVRRNPLYGPG